MLLLQQDLNTVEDPAELVAQALEQFAAEGINRDTSLGVVEAIPPDDAWLLDQVHRAWSGPVTFYPFAGLWLDGLPIDAAQYWVTTRFHFHLLAAAAGARGTAINVHPGYYDVKHRSLLSLGTGWAYAEDLLHHAATPGKNHPHFQVQAQRLACQKLKLAARLYPATDDQSSLDHPPISGVRSWSMPQQRRHSDHLLPKLRRIQSREHL
jgi:hypothetical protein